MAYGSNGNPELGVPPDADLVYDVELHSFENVSIGNGWFYFIAYMILLWLCTINILGKRKLGNGTCRKTTTIHHSQRKGNKILQGIEI